MTYCAECGKQKEDDGNIMCADCLYQIKLRASYPMEEDLIISDYESPKGNKKYALYKIIMATIDRSGGISTFMLWNKQSNRIIYNVPEYNILKVVKKGNIKR